MCQRSSRCTSKSFFPQGTAYTVRVVRRDGRYFIHISIVIRNAQLSRPPEAVVSIDSNPEGFAVAIVKGDGNLAAHKFFRDDRLIYASEGKRDAIIGQLVSEIIEYGGHHGAYTFVIENLRITGHSNFGRRANRLIHAFVRKKFADNLLTKCWKTNHRVFMINPAYTSKIGEIKYTRTYGLSIHEAAALCIGRRFYGFEERLKEPLAITVRTGNKKAKMPVLRVWASLYRYHRPVDPYMEPPGRKGSLGEKQDDGNKAVFTGRPAVPHGMPLIRDEGERKGGECGESPQATGHGGEPAPFGGKVAASSLRDT